MGDKSPESVRLSVCLSFQHLQQFWHIAGILEKVTENAEIAGIVGDLPELPGLSKISIFWLILGRWAFNYLESDTNDDYFRVIFLHLYYSLHMGY